MVVQLLFCSFIYQLKLAGFSLDLCLIWEMYLDYCAKHSVTDLSDSEEKV